MLNRIRLPLFAPADDPATNPGSGAGSAELPSLADAFTGMVTVHDAPDPAAPAASPVAPDPSPPAPAAPVVPAAPAGAEQPKPWTVNEFFEKRYPERPEWLKDDKSVNEWKSARELSKKQLETISDMSAKELALTSEIQALKAGLAEKGGATLPETEAVKKLQQELTEFRQKHETELAEWNTIKSRRDLENNPAFMAKYDGERSLLHEDMSEIATAANLDPAIVDKVLGAKNEYELVKALEGVTDEAASGLLKEKGRSFLALTKEKDAALKGPNVTEQLNRWRDHEQSVQGAFTARFKDALKAQFSAAIPNVVNELSKDGGPFFATPAGKMAIARISEQFERGVDVRPAQVVKALALAEAAPVYRQVAENLGRQLAEAQKLLARYKEADPAALLGDGGATPAAGAPTGMLSGMFGGLVKTQ